MRVGMSVDNGQARGLAISGEIQRYCRPTSSFFLRAALGMIATRGKAATKKRKRMMPTGVGTYEHEETHGHVRARGFLLISIEKQEAWRQHQPGTN